MLSRRQFFRAAAVSAAVLPLSKDLLLFAEPQRRGGAPGGHDGEIILNSNENAYGPLPGAMKAMQDGLRYAHRYPDSHYDALWEALAKHHNVKTENIFLGCGSGDILRMAAEEFTGPSTGFVRPLVMGSPAFEALAMYASRRDAAITKIPLRATDQAHDLEKMLAAAQDRPTLIYVCNPNNPTASLTPRIEIEQFLKKLPKDATVIIDEAYHHFVTDPSYKSFADNSADDPRVIVLRTFSKIYGLAGMRVGYCIAHPQTIEKLGKHYVFDNPNVVGTIGATASLQDSAGLAAATKRIVDDRNRFLAEAQKRHLKVIPSQANFVMFDSGKQVRQAIDFFKKQNVLIGRPFPPYDTHIRVSLGLTDEMQAFWRVWDQYSA
jgi:histidinol-phosphate aminotransferase